MAALAPLAGRTFESRAAYHEALAAALGPQWQDTVDCEVRRPGVDVAAPQVGEVVGYQTNGYLGRYLVILPEPNIIAVRMIRRSAAYDEATDAFSNFIWRVRALVTG